MVWGEKAGYVLFPLEWLKLCLRITPDSSTFSSLVPAEELQQHRVGPSRCASLRSGIGVYLITNRMQAAIQTIVTHELPEPIISRVREVSIPDLR